MLHWRWKYAGISALPSTSRAFQRGSDLHSDRLDRQQSGVSRCSTSSLRISSTDSLQSRWCTSTSLTATEISNIRKHVFLLKNSQCFLSPFPPKSKGLVMNTAVGATPNMSWWCQASGTSSPSGTTSCIFMVATGTVPFRIQCASQGTSLTRRRGWRWKKRPITFPLLASSAPAMSWTCVAPEGI